MCVCVCKYVYVFGRLGREETKDVWKVQPLQILYTTPVVIPIRNFQTQNVAAVHVVVVVCLITTHHKAHTHKIPST